MNAKQQKEPREGEEEEEKRKGKKTQSRYLPTQV